MRGHGNDDRTPGLALVPVASLASADEVNGDHSATDLIFDFSHTDHARRERPFLAAHGHRRVATKNDQTVWLTGLPTRVWALFRAMGLDEYFRVFPDSEEDVD